MKALILAAGLGSRLQNKTANLPKALATISGKPILDYQLTSLLAADIRKIIIVVGYKGYMIQDYVGTAFPRCNVAFVENDEYEASNSSYSFWKAKDLVAGETYLHLNCDVLFSSDLLSRVINSPHPNAIAVRTDLTLSNQMENVTLDGDKISHMSLHNSPDAHGKAFGLAKLSPASTEFIINLLQKYIVNGDKNQNYYGIIHQAVKVMDYHAIISDKYNLQEINTLEDYAKVDKMILNNSLICCT